MPTGSYIALIRNRTDPLFACQSARCNQDEVTAGPPFSIREVEGLQHRPYAPQVSCIDIETCGVPRYGADPRRPCLDWRIGNAVGDHRLIIVTAAT